MNKIYIAFEDGEGNQLIVNGPIDLFVQFLLVMGAVDGDINPDDIMQIWDRISEKTDLKGEVVEE